MAVFTFSGKDLELPAIPEIPGLRSRDRTAWLLQVYVTVRLIDPVSALRVHTGGREFEGRLASKEIGAWVLFDTDDLIQTQSGLADSRALPVDDSKRMIAFTRISESRIPKGAVLNIGIAAKKGSGRGGGFHVQWMGGNQIEFRPLDKNWHGSAASA